MEINIQFYICEAFNVQDLISLRTTFTTAIFPTIAFFLKTRSVTPKRNKISQK